MEYEIVSVTPVGPGRAGLAAQAIRSVSWVDCHVLLNTADPEQPNDTLEAMLDAALKPVHVVNFPCSPCMDFAAMRNACLEAAETLGADWAVFVDTDEEVQAPKTARYQLRVAQHPTLLCKDKVAGYAKPRAVKLNLGAKFIGLTHEFLHNSPFSSYISNEWTFTEAPKTGEELNSKFARDRKLLSKQIERALALSTSKKLFLLDSPIEDYKAARDRSDAQLGRWYFYYSETLKYFLAQGDETVSREDIIRSLSIAAELEPFNENRAWYYWMNGSSHWIAYQQVENRYSDEAQYLQDRAFEAASLALGSFPQAESAWLLSRLYLNRGELSHSAAWARAGLKFLSTPASDSSRSTFRDGWTTSFSGPLTTKPSAQSLEKD